MWTRTVGPMLPMQTRPDATGRYTFPDGSQIWFSPEAGGAWLACWADGTRLSNKTHTGPALFPNPNTAQAALIEGNAGPDTKPVEDAGWGKPE